MGCFVRGGKNGMGCYVRGDKNCMGCFVRGGKSLWDVLSGVSKNGMGCFVPGCFVLHSISLDPLIHLEIVCLGDFNPPPRLCTVFMSAECSGSVGRALDLGLKGCWFQPHWGWSLCVVSLS